MKLSAPIHRLKRQARHLARQDALPLHLALDRVAQAEGFATWSLLDARLAAQTPASTLFARLNPGELVLLGARPGHGKTRLALQLVVKTVAAGKQARFFTLEWTLRDLTAHLRAIGQVPSAIDERLEFDGADAISAGYVIDRLAAAPPGTVVVIDYLQILDQKRAHPELATQVRLLKAFAREHSLIIVMLSQIDRAYDPAAHRLPSLADVRLPNPLDLRLFDKACFLNDGAFRLATVRPAARTGGSGVQKPVA